MSDFTPVGVQSSDAPPAYTTVPQWMTYSGEHPVARELYTVLFSHVNRERGDTIVWPTTETGRADGLHGLAEVREIHEAP